MKKKLLLLLLVGIFFQVAEAQQLKGWYWGFNLHPFTYWHYNKVDYDLGYFNNEPFNNRVLTVVSPDFVKPTNFAGSLSLTKYFDNERFFSEVYLDFATQKQKFRYFEEIKLPKLTYSFDEEIVQIRKNYLKVPLIFGVNLNPGDRMILQVKAGLQASLLLNYRFHRSIKYERVTVDNVKVSSDTTNYYLSGKNYSGNFTNPKSEFSEEKEDWILRRFEVGAISQVGMTYFITDDLLFTFNVRGEYDFTNADNLKAKSTGNWLWYENSSAFFGIYNNVPITERPKSHNIRFGLEFGLRFRIDR